MNGLLLVVIGLLLLFIGITGKFECFSNFFNCVAFGQSPNSGGLPGAAKEIIGKSGGIGLGKIGEIVKTKYGNTGVTGGLIV